MSQGVGKRGGVGDDRKAPSRMFFGHDPVERGQEMADPGLDLGGHRRRSRDGAKRRKEGKGVETLWSLFRLRGSDDQ
jgi:hypothetical protein